jgi:hypothetical protein
MYSVRYFCPILDIFGFFVTSIKCHENSSSGGRVDSYGQTDGQTDRTQVIVVLGDYVKAPDKSKMRSVS